MKHSRSGPAIKGRDRGGPMAVARAPRAEEHLDRVDSLARIFGVPSDRTVPEIALDGCLKRGLIKKATKELELLEIAIILRQIQSAQGSDSPDAKRILKEYPNVEQVFDWARRELLQTKVANRKLPCTKAGRAAGREP